MLHCRLAANRERGHEQLASCAACWPALPHNAAQHRAAQHCSPCVALQVSLQPSLTWFHTGARWCPAWLVSSSLRDCGA